MFAWVSALLLTACNPFDVPEDATRNVEDFHGNYDAGEDDKIWRSFGPEFSQQTTREEWDNLLSTLRDALGKTVSTERVGINHRTSTDGKFLVITMQTQFEKGEGAETFTFQGGDGDRRLIGYNIASDTLMDHMMAATAAQRAGEEEPAAAQ